MQKLDLLSLMPRSTLKDSIEICFIFFRVLLYFLLILELYTIFGIINENEKNGNSLHSTGCGLA
jgi:hypothetical protein